MAAASHTDLDDLLIRSGSGDEAAFRRFYDQTSPAILAFLLRMLPDRFHAEDVLQDTMVVAWNKAREFDPELAGARTWITTIARRRALDVLRSGTRQREIIKGGADDIRSVLSLDDDGSPSLPESSVTANRLAHCFGELSAESAACIRFAYLHGLTFSEIAEQIDRSLNSVKSWVRRGLAKLKACMQS
ncbi:MAG TPA: sigma-70 family RNA polymerase sigma factor [Gammaproteobacteria bacterium]